MGPPALPFERGANFCVDRNCGAACRRRAAGVLPCAPRAACVAASKPSITNSTFSQAAVERERDVILREMEEVESITEEVIFDMLHECAYVGTPLARTILGPVANIQSISAEDIKTYINTHYTAPRMVFAASGAVEHDQVVAGVG